MATNQTTNYQLNQWEPTDQVLRTDFNADNAKLDAALNALSDQVAKKADEEDLTALSESVAAVSAGMGNCDMELLTYLYGDRSNGAVVPHPDHLFFLARRISGRGRPGNPAGPWRR